MRVYVVKPSRLGLIIVGLLIALGLMLGTHRIFSSLPVVSPGPVSQVETNQKVMALTVNVDWGEENIPAMLEIFKQENVKVTFFVSGRWAKNNPDLVKRMDSEGHLVENHAYSHLHPDRISLDENKREILRTEQVLEGITGRKTGFYAPPYGEKGSTTVRAASELGYTTILWTLDTIDWKADSSAELIFQRVVNPTAKMGVKPDKRGAIVLMHPKGNTVKALPLIIGKLKQEGFRLVTIAELMDSRKN